jgi:hypothetical protein
VGKKAITISGGFSSLVGQAGAEIELKVAAVYSPLSSKPVVELASFSRA